VKSNEVLSFLLFISGYMLGRIDSILGLFRRRRSDSFVDKVCNDENQEQKSSKKQLLIDDKKFVTKVSTDKFQKSSELGVKSEVADDIQGETAKLLMLKKKKKG